MMRGWRRYEAVADYGVSLRTQMEQTLRTDWTPLCVVLTDTFYCVQVHIDFLTGTEFCENNVLY